MHRKKKNCLFFPQIAKQSKIKIQLLEKQNAKILTLKNLYKLNEFKPKTTKIYIYIKKKIFLI